MEKFEEYLTYDECPLCHCTERVVEEQIEQAKKEGKIQKDRVPTSQQKLLNLSDPVVNPLLFPINMIYYDICKKIEKTGKES